jgi:DNA-binding transcriptional LysR family regulator
MFRSFPQLEAYYWVARLGSFRAAAERLGVTQPTISIRVRDLEADAGGRLFSRSTRGVRLTDRGRTMFEHVERIMSMLNDLDGRVRDVGPLRGLLRLGIPDSFALRCLPSFMRILQADYPEITVSIIVENSRVLAQRLEEGVLDLAILAQPESFASFRLEGLGRQKLSWIASKTFGIANPHCNAEDLSRMPILTNPSPSPTFSILMDWFSNHGLVPLQINTCNSIAVIKEMVLNNGGICVIPTCIVQPNVLNGSLVELQVDPLLPKQSMFAAYPKRLVTRTVLHIITAIRRAIEGTDFVEPALEEALAPRSGRE